jgi:hypothetical protein
VTGRLDGQLLILLMPSMHDITFEILTRLSHCTEQHFGEDLIVIQIDSDPSITLQPITGLDQQPRFDVLHIRFRQTDYIWTLTGQLRTRAATCSPPIHFIQFPLTNVLIECLVHTVKADSQHLGRRRDI